MNNCCPPRSIEQQICDLQRQIDKLKASITPLTYVGEWNDTTNYNKSGMYVAYNGATYVKRVDGDAVNLSPTLNPDLWQLVAAQGEPGTPGTPGARGERGFAGNPITGSFEPRTGNNYLLVADGAVDLRGISSGSKFLVEVTQDNYPDLNTILYGVYKCTMVTPPTNASNTAVVTREYLYNAKPENITGANAGTPKELNNYTYTPVTFVSNDKTISTIEIPAKNGQSGGAQYIDITEVPSTATQGTLTDAQAELLAADYWENYIRFYGEKFYPQDINIDGGYIVYTHHGETDLKVETVKMIYYIINTKSWSLASATKNKIYYKGIHTLYKDGDDNTQFLSLFYFADNDTRPNSMETLCADLKANGYTLGRQIFSVGQYKNTDGTVYNIEYCNNQGSTLMLNCIAIGKSEQFFTLSIFTRIMCTVIKI